MMACRGNVLMQSRALGTIALVVLSMLSLADLASSQTTPSQPTLGLREQGPQPAPPPQQSGPAPIAPPAGQDNPGLIHQMGKLFEESLSILPTLKSPSETIDDLHARAKDAAKGAGDALSRLAKPGSMVSGRMICPVAANGTPDCQQGADRLCQSKGYKDGRSLNTDSAQSCSARVLIPGRARKPDDCHTDNYVTSALCQ